MAEENEEIAALHFTRQDVVNAVEDLTGNGGELVLDDAQQDQLVQLVVDYLNTEGGAADIGVLVRVFLRNTSRYLAPVVLRS